MKKMLLAGLVVSLGTAALPGSGQTEMIFLSNQLRPIEEAEKVRQVILKDFPAPFEFVVDEPGPWVARVKAETEAGQVSAIIKTEMEQAAQLSVPPGVDVGTGANWLDAKAL